MIPFNKPYLTGKEMHYMYQAVYSGKISGNGLFTQKCQSYFEQTYGFKRTLLTTSCTDALEMCAMLANINSDDEVIVPSFTFVSTALAFVRQGAKIIFADSNSLNSTYCDGILLTKSEESITGIHVIKTDNNKKTGLCSLIGVNKKYKGKGMGKKLWEQALNYWISLNDINKCIVPFSIKNTESFNFHLKIGFNKIEEIKYIYHFRNKTNTKN